MSGHTEGLWDAVANLLRYPEEHVQDEQRMAADYLAAGARRGLQAAGRGFADFIDRTPATEREEAFTRVFDINPACSLELGWQLYGEDYKRGAFLVDMRQLMAAVGVEETAELPDHLIHALRCLERIPEPKATLFSTGYVQPAVRKMLEGYTSDDCPWQRLLTGLLEALEGRYGPTEALAASPTASSPGPYAEVPGCGVPAAPTPPAYEEGADHAW
jgi:nitrate reductase delta subunit